MRKGPRGKDRGGKDNGGKYLVGKIPWVGKKKGENSGEKIPRWKIPES